MTAPSGMPDPNDPWWRTFLLEEQIKPARDFALEHQMNMAEALLALGMVEEWFLFQMKAQFLGVAFADLDRVQVDARAIASVPLSLIRGQHALPVKRDGNTLWVAFDEVDAGTIERIKEATGLHIIPVICMPSALDQAIESMPESGMS
jgi:type IV pilus assembly protein PilB